MSVCMFCTRLGCAQCKTPVGERTRTAYTLNKGNSCGNARNRAMVKDRQNTIAYARAEAALGGWDGKVDYLEPSGQCVPKHIRLGEVPQIHSK